jgi:lysozyme
MTQNQADSQLVLDLTRAEHAVNTLVTVPMTQGIFDSLVDFCYNCGIGAFTGSTMLKLLNAGDMSGAAEQFQLWDHASGVVVAGLLRRRLAEKEEFTNGN